MSICEETPSPAEAKDKFQTIADSGLAGRLQQEEFSSLKGDNVSSSQARHQSVTVGSRVAGKVALQEEALHKIVETERLKREEMDRTLAGKLQDREKGDEAGVQTWLSRELIGFNHTKSRIQEKRDESLVQQLQDEEMALALQEREDQQMATELEQTESSAKLARSLSRPVVMETSPAPFTRSGSGSMGRPPSPGHPFSAEGAQLSRSRTFGAKIESPVLKQRSNPLTTGKKSNSSLHQVIPESPARETIRIGSVPREGHPFLQTAADQQLFKEREETLVAAAVPAPPKRRDPPAYTPMEQPAVPAPKQIETSHPPDLPASGAEPAPPETGQSAGGPEEESPVPPPPFSGLPASKLKQNRRKK